MMSTERREPATTAALVDDRRDLLYALINALPDRIFAKDLECRFVVNNLAHLRALGAGTQQEVLAKTNRYDLVLMDCHMPGMDGYEASRAIRRQAAPLCRVPIVALTANAMEGDEARCREAGMDGYVAKPVTRRTLSAALERWLSAR
jgi:CheY-like chemotaxis protein